ncbi:MAG: DNA mismatch repair endonuclease MutL [Anaerolineales bacterium]|nr:DNA mismatch repair endonuclease MutL [Anaerolineales bacterium]
MPIHILPPHIASQIAAGEVVERPSSVVKELLENAIDAGSSRIDIQIEGGGREIIEVNDDGAGIPSSEILLAVERYATSKLETIEDLFAIQSLGFRGEALASIGSVSRMELLSRHKDEKAGARVVVEGGKTSPSKPVGCPIGTRVVVRDLFHNVPARYKFLKTDQTENRRISDLVSRYALAYPRIVFTLTQDGKQKLVTTGQGSLREAMAGIYGYEIASQMIELAEQQHAPFQVGGLISPSGLTRSNRRELTFFINGRWVQDAGLSVAVMQAYRSLLMVGRFPLVVLNIDLPPDEVDVNVHPTKAEVRFKDQKKVFGVLQRIIRAALVGQAPTPGFSFPNNQTFPSGNRTEGDWVSARFSTAGTSPKYEPAVQTSLPAAGMPLLRSLGQFGTTYLVAEGPDGLYLIDQHAAHERVLFEKMMKAVHEGRIESQNLLTAETIELTTSQADIVREKLDAINSLGFQVEVFGDATFRIRAVPVLLAHISPVRAVQTLVEEFEEDETPLQAEVEELIAARVCKRGAVKAGQVLSLEEQEKLLRDLEACENPRTCPHGRPTMIHLSVQALERQFGRLG